MTLYLHRMYDSVSTTFDGQTHTHMGPIEAFVVSDELTLDAPAPPGPWALNCVPACEASAHEAAPFSSVDPRGVPLTQDEKNAAEAEAARNNVEVANMARAMHRMLQGAAQG